MLPVVAASADLEALDAAMALVGERFGQIDALFANAGVDGLTTVPYIRTDRSAPSVGPVTAA